MIFSPFLATEPGAPLDAIGNAALGSACGIALAWAVATVLTWHNLRGSAAVPVAVLGYVLLTEGGDTFYGWLFLVGGGCATYLRGRSIAEDVRAGGELARTARAARGLLIVVRDWRERQQVVSHAAPIRKDQYALGTDTRGGISWLPLALTQGRHMLLLGATGAGKTTTMLWSLFRHLEAGCAAVVIDPKGDPDLVTRCRYEAHRCGRPFFVFSLDRPEHHWNPVLWGSPSEQADKLIAAEEWTEPHYKRLYQRYLLNVFSALDAGRELADLPRTVELLDPDHLALCCRNIEDESAAERLMEYVASLSNDERRDLAGLRNRVALLVESEHGRMLQAAPDPRDELDLLTVLRTGAVAVFSLNSSRYPETAQLLGAALFQDLKAVSGAMEAIPEWKRPAVVAVDEFAAFGSDNVLGVFQRARSAGISLLLATQELADLRRVDPAFQDQVLGNVETIVAHRQNVPESAELVAEVAGTREVWLHTFQTSEHPSRGRPKEQRGTRRRGHEFLVAPDTVKQLGTGEAIVVRKNPHSVARVRIFSNLRASTASEAPLTRELEIARRAAAFEAVHADDCAPDGFEQEAA